MFLVQLILRLSNRYLIVSDLSTIAFTLDLKIEITKNTKKLGNYL